MHVGTRAPADAPLGAPAPPAPLERSRTGGHATPRKLGRLAGSHATPRELGRPVGGHATPLELGRLAGTPTLCYSTSSRHWWLWWPCPECGGVRLPLRGSAGGRPPVYVIRAAAATDHCPGCETRRRRSEAARLEPTVWYDTQLRDWVVRLKGAVILPLELRWFDVPQPTVYRAASDLACLGDELDS
jgi:hypothetical protein